MNKAINFTKTILIIPLAIVVASYASVISLELQDDYYIAGPRVLVDASRDGGVWWAPQWEEEGGFDPDLYHQGKILADYLKSQGMVVTELPRPFTITTELLNDYQMVVRVNAYTQGYSLDEIAAYHQYVENGGPLILLGGDSGQDLFDELALSFGLEFHGGLTGFVDSFAEHPITSGIQPFLYQDGSVLVEDPPPDTIELGFFDTQIAMGLLPYGFGQVFFIGDAGNIVSAEQPLTENLFSYFLTFEGLASQVLYADLDTKAESGLLVKLDKASKSRSEGRLKPMDNQLQAFINQVEALLNSGRIDSTTGEQLIGAALNMMSSDRNVSELSCLCWSPEDIASLPMKKTEASCITDGWRLDISQEGVCEHSYSVGIDANSNLSCVTNRFDCPGLPDLGGESIETNEDEFLVCMIQIINRCEELGIEVPEYP